MYFSIALSFDRSCSKQRTTWTESSRAGGVRPCAGRGAAADENCQRFKVAVPRSEPLTLRGDLELLHAVGHVGGKNYSHDGE